MEAASRYAAKTASAPNPVVSPLLLLPPAFSIAFVLASAAFAATDASAAASAAFRKSLTSAHALGATQCFAPPFSFAGITSGSMPHPVFGVGIHASARRRVNSIAAATASPPSPASSCSNSAESSPNAASSAATAGSFIHHGCAVRPATWWSGNCHRVVQLSTGPAAYGSSAQFGPGIAAAAAKAATAPASVGAKRTVPRAMGARHER